MNKFPQSIKEIDLTHINTADFKNRHISCFVLTYDNKILLQQRGYNWKRFPGLLSTFGGIESSENAEQALIRELREELGAQVQASEILSLGAYTEAITDHKELIYGFFWHDQRGTITGCYEGEAKYFTNIKAVYEHPKIMDDVLWLLRQCQIGLVANVCSVLFSKTGYPFSRLTLSYNL